jgi:nucleotide-binding universal stress UspA family protein
MAVSFNKVLIPVDFSLNTEIAIKRALGLIGGDDAILHLLHVVRPGRQAAYQFKVWAAEQALEKWVSTIHDLQGGVRVKTHILKGRSAQRMIIECSGMVKPDLIIIGKQNSNRRWPFFAGVSPAGIAKKSNYPVLTVKPGSAGSRTRVIVIPVRDFLPERKLEWAVMLARRYKAQIHLLAIHDEPEPKDWALPQAFLRAYHYLRTQMHHPIEYASSGRLSPAKATLNYAELIMADMILVNPEVESGIPGFGGLRHISDLLGRDSSIQVLDVEPYP